MKWPYISAVCLILAVGSLPALPSQESSLKISAMIFESRPQIVSVASAGDDGTGVIAGTIVGGMVTSAFPNGTVLMKLDGPNGFNEASIRDLVKRSFVFNCGSISEGLHAFFLNRIDYSFGEGASTAPGPRAVPGSALETASMTSLDFDLGVISERADEVILSLTFGPGRGPWTEPILTGQIVGIKKGEPLLVGVPYLFRGKYVFWIALLAENTQKP